MSKDPAALISPASPQTLIAYRQLEIVGTQSLSCTQAGAIQSYECILLTPVTWTTPLSLDSKPQEPIGIHRDSKQYKGLYRRLREQIYKDDLTYKRKSRNTSNSIDYCLITGLIPEGQVPCISNTLTHRNQGVCVYVCVSCFNRPLGKMTWIEMFVECFGYTQYSVSISPTLHYFILTNNSIKHITFF